MRRFLPRQLTYLLLLVFFVSSACGGCDEVGESDLSDVGGDASLSDASVDADNQFNDDEPCDEEGETRPCGTDVGECEKGEEMCLFGVWQDCEGGVEPQPERCDGLDNSCSGEIDDGAVEEMCDLDSACFENPQCVDGQCEYDEALGCSFMDGPCTFGDCDTKSGQCFQHTVSDGVECDDGDFCTVAGTCQDGICETVPRDCSDAGDQCNVGVCDSEMEACQPFPVSDGASCDDGLFCTVASLCFDGDCTGQPRDCSDFDDQCNQGVCNEGDESCEAAPVEEGSDCDDGLYCTVNTSCSDGECAGAPRDCSDYTDQCNVGVCNEDDDSCEAEPVDDGASCDDGDYCTINTECSDGECTGIPRDCSDLTDECNVGVCDSEAESCVAVPVSDGTSCDDGLYCTVNTSCSDGACTGSPRSCSSASDQCNEGVCNEDENTCEPLPVSDGTECDNGLYCTINDTCEEGVCTAGDDRSCSAADGACREGECDEENNTCTGDPLPDGSSCDDGLYCTVNTTCSDGECVDSQPRDCSGEGDQCNAGICDEDNNTCTSEPVADNTPCDDGSFCTVDNVCQQGSCVGESRDCSGLDDQCNEGSCSESQESCVAVPANSGDSCDDGAFCTVDTVCTSDGTCQGEPRDCSALDDSCQFGTCDENAGSCVAEDEPDGLSCDDGVYCTVGTECQAGQCTDGEPRDCSDAGDQCNDGVCDESSQSCISEPVADGTSCDDGVFCTENDTCQDGSCSGEPRDCSHLEDQCTSASCSESQQSCVTSPTNIGNTCDDGYYCTVDTVCTDDGQCADGEPRDCSEFDTACQFGACDESANACVAEDEPDGMSCDDGLFCTMNEECSDGECVSEPYECSDYEDECHEAQCDEAAGECDVTNICDPCAEGNPVADAGSDQQVVPNSVVNLDGSDSHDDEGQDLEYDWYIEEQPSGSDASIDDPNSETPSFTADVAGEFVVCLEVTNEDDCDSTQTDESCVTISVVPDVDLHIELTWDVDDPIDLDLQYRHPGTDWFQAPGGSGGPNNPCNAATDAVPYGVWWCSENPDWGTTDAHNPELDIDSLEGEEPENINQEELFDAEGFRVGVHHWWDYENGPAEGRVRIYVGGELVFEESHTTACGDMWEVADIDVDNDGQTVEITSLDYQVVQGTMGPCQ